MLIILGILGQIIHFFSVFSGNYLLIFQNNYELRPTGGFISAYGVWDTPFDVSFYDVYGEIDEHEYIDPPHYPMYELLYSETYGGYTFRDTNYYLDFRDSADEMIDFYKKTNLQAQIDGIIAIDFSMLEDLIGIYEPIKADGITLTANNLFETLEAEVSDINRHSEEEIGTRKDIMKKIVKKLVINAAFSPLKLPELYSTVKTNLNEKHMVLWFSDEDLEQEAIEKGWADIIPEYEYDLLAVNEANLGGMKNDRYISRNIKYEVDLESLTANLTIDIDHFGGTNIPLSGDYKGYFRALTPAGEVGDIVRLSATQETTLTYAYDLPAVDNTYTLDLIKQPGTNADHYEIIIHAPQGTQLASEDFDVMEEHAYLGIDLDTDKTLSLELFPDQTAPRIHSHELVELNKIWIGFNEPLDCESASDPFAYTIVDTDETDSRHDSPTIDTITCYERHVWLDTLGITEQNEEFYDITLRNIRDKSGNYISPNPRTITVVQRYL